MAAAGEIASWAMGELGDNLAQYAITSGLSFLGIEGGDDVDAKLDEMNGKLDQILSQMDVMNTKLDALSTSINELTSEVDIGLKESYAQISEARLSSVYGDIRRKFGSPRSAGFDNLFGLMHLPPGGKQAAASNAAPFLAADHWRDVNSINDALTVKVGSSETLLQKWATLIVSKLHDQGGGGVKFGSYAGVYEGWYTEAVSYQLKAFAIILFCVGSDKDKQNTARRRMLAMMQDQGAMYLDGLERMALACATVAPTGPTLAIQRAKWAAGTHAWLLRGDVLTRSLNVSLTPGAGNGVLQDNLLNGAYARVLLRPSDLKPGGAPPDRIAFSKPRVLRNWTTADKPGEVTLGTVTEFQGVDWEPSTSAFAKLKPPGKSGLRFARCFWPSPGNYQLSYFWVYLYLCGPEPIPPQLPLQKKTHQLLQVRAAIQHHQRGAVQSRREVGSVLPRRSHRTAHRPARDAPALRRRGLARGRQTGALHDSLAGRLERRRQRPDLRARSRR